MLPEIPAFLAQQPGGVESTSLIDWWTLSAQVFNFLLLVVLLRVFLYGRVVRAMDQREKKIASHFEAAQQKEQDAEARVQALQREKDELEQKRQSMLSEARQQADEHRRELTRKAREEVQAQANRWYEDLERGKEAFLQEMRDSAGKGVCAIARKALADLADTELERAMVTVLIRRLEELSDDARRELTEAMADDERGLVVATAWDLPEPERDRVAQATRKYFSDDAEISFETAPELTCGIELRAGGREISWTIDGYVERMREQLGEMVDRTVAAESRRTEADKESTDLDDAQRTETEKNATNAAEQTEQESSNE